jgi:hypothetical protein
MLEFVVDLGALCEWERRRKDEGKGEEMKRESECEGAEKEGGNVGELACTVESGVWDLIRILSSIISLS